MRAASAAGSRISALVSLTADAGRAATASAAARARARSSARGHTSLAMPHSTAFLASTASPSTNIEKARAWPIRAGSVRLEAASGISARFTNGVVSTASSDTNTRSQCSSIVVPTPTARPFTAATSGVVARASAASSGLPPARAASGSPRLAAAKSPRSLPAVKTSPSA